MSEEKKSGREVYEIHPAANSFPMLPADELKRLAEDIKANGLQEPIVMFENRADKRRYILDGRNRLAAMEMIQMHADPERHITEVRDIDVDPYSYVISKNIRRRHLTKE